MTVHYTYLRVGPKLSFSRTWLLTFVLCGLLNNTEAQLSWETLPNAPRYVRFDDVFFLNPDLGWTVRPANLYGNSSWYGQIYRTRDGGESWQLLKDSSPTYYRSIGFADSLTGWIGNLGDTSRVNNIPTTTDTIPLYFTTNGGNSWAPVNNIPVPKPKGICGISVATDSVIYAYGRWYGPPVLLKTTDKGNTWNSKSMSAYAGGLIDGYFFNKDTGFISGTSPGQKAMILKTEDGGNSWKTVYQSVRNDTDGVWKLSFPAGATGYATIERWARSTWNQNTWFLKTTDSGNTWQEHPFNTATDLQGIGFINDSTGWMGGWGMPNYKTSDGGKTWSIDKTFGVKTPVYCFGIDTAYNINRFRRFGDTLMYASGNTIYKLQKNKSGTGLAETLNPDPDFNIYPNPFSDEAIISYRVQQATALTLVIYNVIGEKIYSENLGMQPEGNYYYNLHANLHPGIYYCTISGPVYSYRTKMIIATK